MTVGDKPDTKAAGIAGILAGAGLLIEFVFFMASGWQPDVFADPAVALAFLEERGGYMRAAGLAGAVNLCFATIFVAGLAARLQREPTVAAATLYLGVVFIAVHALVPIGLWIGAPTFGAMAVHSAAVVQPAWAAFAKFMAVAGGVGYLFLGLSMIAAGFGGASSRALPPALAWLTMSHLSAQRPVSARRRVRVPRSAAGRARAPRRAAGPLSRAPDPGRVPAVRRRRRPALVASAERARQLRVW